MVSHRVVIIGAGLGGLAAALELARRGFDVTVLERHSTVGGKASERFENGFRWDEGPSIVVMPWVYRELFASAGQDPDSYLPMKRLDPAFRVVLSDGRPLDIGDGENGLRAALASIDERDAAALGPFLKKVDAFARVIGHAYCDRIVETWPQVMLSPLMVSAAVMPPTRPYALEIEQHFRNPAVRELFYGFATYSGFPPEKAPASMTIVPWTILREGVWYPTQGGIAAIPRAIAAACRDHGVEIRTDVEVEAIVRDAAGRVRSVETTVGSFRTPIVVSNSDYVHTFRLLRGGPELPPEALRIRRGEAQPSSSFFTVQIAASRRWDQAAHHLLVLTPGSNRVYREVFEEHRFATDPPIYVNTTCATVPEDAPAGCSNPFVVVGAPPLREGETPDPNFEAQYADQLMRRLDEADLPGLRDSATRVHITGQAEWQRRFHAFRGAIYGLGTEHNILGGGFRPLPYLAEVPGLYFVGGGVQPGPGMPMVVQSGKIVAARIARDVPAQKLRRIVVPDPEPAEVFEDDDPKAPDGDRP